ncbi:MAG: alpha/beta hydrolase [Sedimentisphaerales bacterium]|nr:alpha/beta hydrolase [Sedimentisphaerales bacterium]
MNRILIVTMALLSVCINAGYHSSTSSAGIQTRDEAIILKIWPAKALDAGSSVQTEKNEPDRGDNVTRVGNVTDPAIMIFKPKQSQDKTASVIVCPGGGYRYLTINKEGTEIAEWLNSLGVTAIVLKYRVPNQRENAFKDIQRAMRVARYHAEEWGIDANQIGVMGFSAGAHLSARLSGDFFNSSYEHVDEIDVLSCRPNFTILLYPAYLVDDRNNLRDDIKVGSENPPAFIVQTQDDSVGVKNSIYYYAALQKAKIPSELHIFPTGGHGYGMRPSSHAVSKWPLLCEEWLRQIDMVGD